MNKVEEKAADIKKLKIIANELRKDSLRMITLANSGHPGGSLSIAEIIACLYFHEMNFNKDLLKSKERDRLVLSKGHCAPIQYAALAKLEIIPKEELDYLRKIDHMLQGHPDRNKTAGIEVNTGSLGQGFSQAVGIALAGKIDKLEYRTFVILGDGEIQEGQIWEAAMAASHFKLTNLVAFVDHNRLQIDGCVKDIMNVEPIEDKFKAFGWSVYKINGHNVEQILDTLEFTKNASRPTMIVLETVKSKGVSFMENSCEWHGKALNKEMLEKALKEINNTIKEIG